MSDQSTRLGLPYILPSQAQKHVTHNEAVRLLDALVQLSVEEFDALIPPATPMIGASYALGAAPTGDWAGQGGALALFEEDGWRFLVPQEGWLAWGRLAGELRVFTSAGWVPVPMAGEQVARLGVGTAPDAINRLAVASAATLMTHDGAGHRLKVNKATDADTASLVFQSGWTGHAEMGLAGDTAFSVKVSADGVNWSEAMRADPVAQTISWAPAGAGRMALDDTALQVDVPVTGVAVQMEATDTTAGRLMRADYGYSPGNLVGAVSQSGGIPSGAVIERGSNANGEYVRWADGTQICTRVFNAGSIIASGAGTFSSPYNTAVVNLDFAASFAAAPVVNISGFIPTASTSIARRLTAGCFRNVDTARIYQAHVVRLSGDATADDAMINLSAVGRWF